MLHRSLYGLKQCPCSWFGKFSYIVQNVGIKHSEAYHLIFYYHASPGKCVYLIVHVDDIGNDATRISQLKEHLCKHLKPRILEVSNPWVLKYFNQKKVLYSLNGNIL